jgi:DNA-directed RNA polymerase subunit beta
MRFIVELERKYIMTYKIKTVNRGVERRDYTKVSGDLPLPNLIEIQTDTFK